MARFVLSPLVLTHKLAADVSLASVNSDLPTDDNKKQNDGKCVKTILSGYYQWKSSPHSNS
jgi:hypothetical protein